MSDNTKTVEQMTAPRPHERELAALERLIVKAKRRLTVCERHGKRIAAQELLVQLRALAIGRESILQTTEAARVRELLRLAEQRAKITADHRDQLTAEIDHLKTLQVVLQAERDLALEAAKNVQVWGVYVLQRRIEQLETQLRIEKSFSTCLRKIVTDVAADRWKITRKLSALVEAIRRRRKT
jgi:hypothetical protein